MTIGILPAAGKAERLYGLPKYLLPIPGGYLMRRHIELMRAARCEALYIGTNSDNWELIHDYEGDALDVTIATANPCDTMSETVLRFNSGWRLGENVLFAMPDTFITDETIYSTMREVIENQDYLVVAGVFLAKEKNRSKLGMCDIENNLIKNIVDKPAHTDLTHSWAMLAWKPSFWQYIKPEDSHVGFAVQRAIEDGVNVRAVYATGRCYDCGTIEGYYDLLKDIME